MHKYITILILFSLLCAMGLILFFHTTRSGSPVWRQVVAPASPAAISPETAARADRQTPLPPVSPPPAINPSAGRPQAAARVTSTGLSPSSAPPGAPSLPASSARPPANSLSAPATPAGISPETPSAPAPFPLLPSSETRTISSTPPPKEEQPAPDQSVAPSAGDKPASTAAPSPAASAAPRDNSTSPPPALNPASLSLTATHVLKNMEISLSGQKVLLRIEAEDPFPCKAFILSNPPRLVVDLPGSWQKMRPPAVPSNRVVKGVRMGTQSTGPRLVLDMSNPPRYEISRPTDATVVIAVR